MKLQIETSVYNERRYGKPWIAIVDFSSNKKGDFNFGDWIGEQGFAGELELDINPGDIVARGQKDNRKPANSTPKYFIVLENNELKDVSKIEAYKHSQNNLAPSKNELIARKNKLLDEIRKIDEILNY